MAKRLPPLNALHSFVVTAQHDSFTQAAEALNITQGAVSRQIATLEEHLGFALFSRHARGLSLTQQGAALLPQVEQAFSLIHEAVDSASARQDVIRLKASTCIMRWLLPRLMTLSAAHPELTVELTTKVKHGIDFSREHFDAAIIYCQQPPSDMISHHLFTEYLTPMLAPSLLPEVGGFSSVEQLTGLTWLHATADDWDWQLWLDHCNAQDLQADTHQHFDTLDLAMNSAAQGFGVTIGDKVIAADDLQQQRLIAPFVETVTSGKSYYLVYPAESVAADSLAVFKDWLLSQVGPVPN